MQTMRLTRDQIPAEALEQMKREGWPMPEEVQAYWDVKEKEITNGNNQQIQSTSAAG